MKRLALAVFLLASGSSLASANCLDDFNALMHRNMSSGPYRAVTEIAIANAAGEFYPVANTSWDVFPPDAAHSEMTSTANATALQITVVGDRAWEFSPASSSWSVKTADYARSILDMLKSRGYRIAPEYSDVKCQGTIVYAGKGYLAFQYKEPKNPQIQQMNIYFDSQTKRPVRSIGVGEVYGHGLRVVTVFSFDPAPKIEPPRL